MTFDELQLDQEILQGISDAGFERCTDVQARTIPLVLSGSDVMVQSQTGTGKTAAFLIPTFQLLLHNETYKGSRALVIAPTRELAVQIKEESDVLSYRLPLRSEVFHGGVGYKPQLDALRLGVDIMVGTPGRVIDLTQSGQMPLKDVRIVVIDEADRLFDMGFYPDLRRIMRMLQPREQRINMLFSATLSTKARNIAWDHMNDPNEIEIEPEHLTVETVEQRLYHVPTEEKISVLLGILAKEKPRNAIIFTNTKRYAEEVSRRLEMNGYPSEFIIGDLPQRKRLSIIRKLKSGEAEFLVATDVAARGLHIDNLEMVINFDLPEDPEAYVHRIGRTARAGESGLAVSLACQRYVFGLDAIESLIEQKIPVAKLTDELYAEDASAGRRISVRSDARDGDRRGGRGRGSGGHHSRGGRSEGRPRSDSRPRGDSRRKPPRERTAAEHTVRERGGRDRPQRDHRDHRDHKAHPSETRGTPSAADSLEQRLAYYRKKYGEDFQPTDEMLASMEGGGARGGGSRSGGSGGTSKRKRSRSRGKGGGARPVGAATSDRTATPRTDTRSVDTGSVDTPSRKKGRTNTPPASTKKKKKRGLGGVLRSLFGGDED